MELSHAVHTHVEFCTVSSSDSVSIALGIIGIALLYP